MEKICRVLLVDDEYITRGFYKTLFKELSKITDNVFIIQESSSYSEAYKCIIGDNDKLDIVILDLTILSSFEERLLSGLDIGKLIRRHRPNTKIVVISSITPQSEYQFLFNEINPDACMFKNSITTHDIKQALCNVIQAGTFYCYTTNRFMKNGILKHLDIDEIDLKLLSELTLGSTTRELEKIIFLSRRTIEYRKKALKEKLDVINGSTRDLILKAKSLKLI